jgi:hypothetical protein
MSDREYAAAYRAMILHPMYAMWWGVVTRRWEPPR